MKFGLVSVIVMAVAICPASRTNITRTICPANTMRMSLYMCVRVILSSAAPGAAVAEAVDDEMIERLVQTVERMQEEIHKLKGEINRCNNHTKDSLKRLLLPNVDEAYVKVAFDAILTHNLDHSSIEDTTIVFDSILTNVGNAYAKDLGAFIAPVPGVYLFTYTIHSAAAGNIFATLMVDGQRKTIIQVDGSGQSLLKASSSRTSILSLNQGDRAYIQILKSSRGLLLSTDYGHSAFAGALLFTN